MSSPRRAADPDHAAQATRPITAWPARPRRTDYSVRDRALTQQAGSSTDSALFRRRNNADCADVVIVPT